MLIVPYCWEKASIINKGQDNFTKPSKLLPHEVNVKIGGIIIDNRRVNIFHIVMQESWECITGSCREDCHKLLKWFEGRSNIKFRDAFLRYANISEEWRVVEGIKPWPTWNSFVIISTYPLQCLHIAFADIVPQL